MDCGYRINGICASEDIGGVEVDYEESGMCSWDDSEYILTFRNYNNFTVNVLWKIEKSTREGDTYTKSGSLVIEGKDSKRTSIGKAKEFSITGLIVRKLAQ